MKLLEKLLLATDLSETSGTLVENAIKLAKVFNSKITLIHVLPEAIKDETTRILIRKSINSQLVKINSRIKREGLVTTEPVLEYGNHFDKINQLADKMDANLIMVGSGNKPEDEIFKLGTTTEKIIRKSSKPIWVIKDSGFLKIDKILCPVDFSPESARALKNAITLAHRFSAELNVFSAYESFSEGSFKIHVDWNIINEDAREEHALEFNSFLDKFNFVDLKWNKEIRCGDPSKEILAAIKINQHDLLIMGTTGKSGLSRMLLGSVTEKVIREVPCSFITLKSEDLINLELNTEIRDIESHYNVAKQLIKDGFINEAINEYKICLGINDMHLPTLIGIASAYKKIGDSKTSLIYKNIEDEVLTRIWDRKIEEEVRRLYK